jgi:hypothetical protein
MWHSGRARSAWGIGSLCAEARVHSFHDSLDTGGVGEYAPGDLTLEVIGQSP